MNVLIDTNIFIPLETKRVSDIETETHDINELYRISKQINYHVFLLDVQKREIQKDKDSERKKLRLLSFEKYEVLENVSLLPVIKRTFPNVIPDSHDYYDVALLNALCSNAVSILITNDIGIHSKAKLVNEQERVYFVSDALDLFRGQLPKGLFIQNPHPVVKKDKCFNLDLNDSFFDSLRRDYSGFDNWFKEKCQKGQRDALVIRSNENLVGLCIYKNEDPCYDMSGSILKICTFKLSAVGNKLGELLLKKMLDYSYSSKYDWLYVTAFEKNYICKFFENFGFEKYHTRKEDTGELIYRRRMIPSENDLRNLNPLEYNIKFGPRFFNEDVPSFLVPVKKEYHEILFPDVLPCSLFPESDYSVSASNAITKAYISNSNTNLINPGALFFFYESHSDKRIQMRGVVEKVKRSNDLNEVLSITGQRTVYNRREIENMMNDDLLVVLFRLIDSYDRPIDIRWLLRGNLIKGIPQSITKLSEEAKKWLLAQQ